MKHLFKLVFLFVATVFLFACDKEAEKKEPAIKEWTFTAPSFIASNNTLSFDLETATAVTISWNAAVPSEDYRVTYSLDLFLADAATPFKTIVPGTNGSETSVTLTVQETDLLLEMLNIGAGQTALGKAVLKASCIDKVETIQIPLAITRKAPLAPTEITTLFLSGTATEQGDVLANAIALKRMKDAAGLPTAEFEVYTKLKAAGNYKFYVANSLPTFVYGGNNNQGEIALQGAALTVAEDAIYRVRVNTSTLTYSLFKVERLGAIGGPLLGWNDDVPMQYKGLGMWELKYSFQNNQNYVLRLNGAFGDKDAQVFKPIAGTSELMLGAEAAALGLTQEDFFAPAIGAYILTVNLSGSGFNYTLVKDPDAGVPMPDALYLFENGVKIHDFVKDQANNLFKSGVYLALQKGKTYSVNSAADGKGTSYSLGEAIALGQGPDTWETRYKFAAGGNGQFTLDQDHAYTVEYNFNTGEFKWRYHQIKLFHWDEEGVGRTWDNKDEFVMTYVHPFKYTVKAKLEAGYEMKFFCPWEVEFGVGADDNASALIGTMTGQGTRANFSNLTETGDYKIDIEVNNTFTAGSYSIVK